VLGLPDFPAQNLRQDSQGCGRQACTENEAREEREEMKKLEDMTTDELVDWAAGNLIVAIGQGKFRERLCGVLLAVQQFSFARGHKQGRKKVARA
jgi:hypothetical protein